MRNYTSKVPAEESIEAIEYMLVRFGALGINKRYHEGLAVGITFVIEAPETRLPVGITLPAQTEAAYDVLLKGLKSRPTEHTRKKLRDQARRTAWRIMHDWVSVQLAMIEMKQAELRQVFLPYITGSDGTTIYQFLKENQLPALGFRGEPKEEVSTNE